MFGLTSNALDTVHAPQMLETLAKYKIRWGPLRLHFVFWSVLGWLCSLAVEDWSRHLSVVVCALAG